VKNKWIPNYSIPSLYPSVTNKNDGAGWRKSHGANLRHHFCSLKPQNDGANFPVMWSGKINLTTFESTAIRNY